MSVGLAVPQGRFRDNSMMQAQGNQETMDSSDESRNAAQAPLGNEDSTDGETAPASAVGQGEEQSEQQNHGPEKENPLANLDSDKVPPGSDQALFNDPSADPLWNPELEPDPTADPLAGRKSSGEDSGAGNGTDG